MNGWPRESGAAPILSDLLRVAPHRATLWQWCPLFLRPALPFIPWSRLALMILPFILHLHCLFILMTLRRNVNFWCLCLNFFHDFIEFLFSIAFEHVLLSSFRQSEAMISPRIKIRIFEIRNEIFSKSYSPILRELRSVKTILQIVVFYERKLLFLALSQEEWIHLRISLDREEATRACFTRVYLLQTTIPDRREIPNAWLCLVNGLSNVSINTRGNFPAGYLVSISSVTPSITTIIERLLGRASSALNDLIKESRLRDSNGRTKGRPTSHPNDSRTLSRVSARKRPFLAS